MAQFIEFLGNHPILFGCWLAAFAAIVFYHQRTGAKGVSPAQAVGLINRSDAAVVDIRDKKEFDEGHIVDALHIPAAKLAQRLAELKKKQSKPIIVVCKMGQQAGESVKALEAAGFESVYKLLGGMTEWRGQSLPVVMK
jgi:rhodanese-related sulfurtransferase